jgi:hypothetical protein
LGRPILTACIEQEPKDDPRRPAHHPHQGAAHRRNDAVDILRVPRLQRRSRGREPLRHADPMVAIPDWRSTSYSNFGVTTAAATAIIWLAPGGRQVPPTLAPPYRRLEKTGDHTGQS